mgnify:CR=1 FL=1
MEKKNCQIFGIYFNQIVVKYDLIKFNFYYKTLLNFKQLSVKLLVNFLFGFCQILVKFWKTFFQSNFGQKNIPLGKYEHRPLDGNI